MPKLSSARIQELHVSYSHFRDSSVYFCLEMLTVMTWCKIHKKKQDLHWDLKRATSEQMSELSYRLGSEEKPSWSSVEAVQNCWARNSPKETELTNSWDAFLKLLWILFNATLEAQVSNTTV